MNPTCSQRESRHVRVEGFFENVSEDRISSFFAQFGRIHKVTINDKGLVVVSFMDVRSAQKAYLANPKYEGRHLRLYYHELSNQSKSESDAGKLTRPSSAMSGLSSDRQNSIEEKVEKKRIDRLQKYENDRPSRPNSINDASCSAELQHSSNTDYSKNPQSNSNEAKEFSSSKADEQARNTMRRHKEKPASIIENSSGNLRSECSDLYVSSTSCLDKYNENQTKETNGGLLGVYVSPLPFEKSEDYLRVLLTKIASQSAKVICIQFDVNEKSRRALILLQNTTCIKVLLSNLCQSSIGKLEAVVADHISVAEAHNDYLAKTCAIVAGITLPQSKNFSFDATPQLSDDSHSNLSSLKIRSTNFEKKKPICLKTGADNFQSSSISLSNSTTATSNSAPTTSSSSLSNHFSNSFSTMSISSVASSIYGISSVNADPLHKNASRTLYVRNLERRVTDESLKARFGVFGHILDIDVKNRDTPSPFAFIQFTNINSVVATIRSCQSSKSINSMSGDLATDGVSALKPLKTNWGKSICSNKLWIGCLPDSCSEKYLYSKLRTVTPDDVVNVIYDPNYHETIVAYKTNEAAQIACNKIKNKVLTFPPEKAQKENCSHVHVDFCSDKLHDFFLDRKFGRFGDSACAAIPIEQDEHDVSGVSKPFSSTALNVSSSDSAVLSPLSTSKNKGHISPTDPSHKNRANSSLILAPPPDPPKNLRLNEANETEGRYSSGQDGNWNDANSSAILSDLTFSSNGRNIQRSELLVNRKSLSDFNSKGVKSLKTETDRERYRRSNTTKKREKNHSSHQSFENRGKGRSSSSSSCSSLSLTSDSFSSTSDTEQKQDKNLTGHRWNYSSRDRSQRHHRSKRKETEIDNVSNSENSCKRFDASSSSFSSNHYNNKSSSSKNNKRSRETLRNESSKLAKPGGEEGSYKSIRKSTSPLCPPPPMPTLKKSSNALLERINSKKRSKHVAQRDVSSNSSSSSSSMSSLKKVNKETKISEKCERRKSGDQSNGEANSSHNWHEHDNVLRSSNAPPSMTIPSSSSTTQTTTTSTPGQHRTSLEMRLFDLYGTRHATNSPTKLQQDQKPCLKEEKGQFLDNLLPNCTPSAVGPLSAPIVGKGNNNDLKSLSNRRTSSHSVSNSIHQRHGEKNSRNLRPLVKVPTNIPLSAATHALFIDGLIDPRIKKSHLSRVVANSSLNLPLPRFSVNILSKLELRNYSSSTEKGILNKPTSSVASQPPHQLTAVNELNLETNNACCSKLDVTNNLSNDTGDSFIFSSAASASSQIVTDIKQSDHTNDSKSPIKEKQKVHGKPLKENGTNANDLEVEEEGSSGVQPKNELVSDLFHVAKYFHNISSSSSLAQRLSDLKNKLNNAQESIQKTKMSAAVLTVRRATSIEEELERLKAKHSVMEEFSTSKMNDSPKSLSLPKRSLSVYLPSTSELSPAATSQFKNSFGSTTLSKTAGVEPNIAPSFVKEDNSTNAQQHVEENKQFIESSANLPTKEIANTLGKHKPLSSKTASDASHQSSSTQGTSPTPEDKDVKKVEDNVTYVHSSSNSNTMNTINVGAQQQMNSEHSTSIVISKSSVPHIAPVKEIRNRRILDDLFRQQAKDSKRISVSNKDEKRKSDASDNSKAALLATCANMTEFIKEKDIRAKMERKEPPRKMEQNSTPKNSQLNFINKDHNADQHTKNKERHHAHPYKMDDTLPDSLIVKQEKPSSIQSHTKHINTSNKEKKEHNDGHIVDKAKKKKEKLKLEDKVKHEVTKKYNKKKKHCSSSGSSASDFENSSSLFSEFGIAGIDIEEQRRLLQDIKAGNYGMSMYDRVKRRSSAIKPDEQKKKSEALQKLRQKSKKSKGNRVRVRLSSSDNSSSDSEDLAEDNLKSQSESSSEDSDDASKSKNNFSTDLTSNPKKAPSETPSLPASKVLHKKKANVKKESNDDVISESNDSADSDSSATPKSNDDDRVSMNSQSAIPTKKIHEETCKTDSVKKNLDEAKDRKIAEVLHKPNKTSRKELIKSHNDVVSQNKAKKSDKSTKENFSVKEEKKSENSAKIQEKLSRGAVASRSPSDSSEDSDKDGSDSSHATSTDGEPYIKNLRKKLSKCRSSSDEDDNKKIQAESSNAAKLLKTPKPVSKSERNVSTGKAVVKKHPPKKVKHLLMDDVFGNGSSEDENSTMSFFKSTLDSSLAKKPTQQSKALATSEKQRSTKHKEKHEKDESHKYSNIEKESAKRKKTSVYESESDTNSRPSGKRKMLFAATKSEQVEVQKIKKRHMQDSDDEKVKKLRKIDEKHASACNADSKPKVGWTQSSVGQHLKNENSDHQRHEPNYNSKGSIAAEHWHNSDSVRKTEVQNFTSNEFGGKHIEHKQQESNSSSSTDTSSSSSGSSSSSSDEEEENKCSSSSFITSIEASRRQQLERERATGTQMPKLDNNEVLKVNTGKTNIKDHLLSPRKQFTIDNKSLLSESEKYLHDDEKFKGLTNQFSEKRANYSKTVPIDKIPTTSEDKKASGGRFNESASSSNASTTHKKKTKLDKSKPEKQPAKPDNLMETTATLTDDYVNKLVEELNAKSSVDEFEIIESGTVQLNVDKGTVDNSYNSSSFCNPEHQTSSNLLQKFSKTAPNSKQQKNVGHNVEKKRPEKDSKHGRQLNSVNAKNDINLTPKESEVDDDDELLRKMREEEEAAVMNLTDFSCFETSTNIDVDTAVNDIAFNRSSDIIEKAHEETALINTVVKKENIDDTINERFNNSSIIKTAIDEANCSSTISNTTEKKCNDTEMELEKLNSRNVEEERQISNEFIDNGGGYMEIDAEHLLRQQREQEEEEKREEEKRRAEELAMKANTESVAFTVVPSLIPTSLPFSQQIPQHGVLEGVSIPSQSINSVGAQTWECNRVDAQQQFQHIQHNFNGASQPIGHNISQLDHSQQQISDHAQNSSMQQTSLVQPQRNQSCVILKSPQQSSHHAVQPQMAQLHAVNNKTVTENEQRSAYNMAGYIAVSSTADTVLPQQQSYEQSQQRYVQETPASMNLKNSSTVGSGGVLPQCTALPNLSLMNQPIATETSDAVQSQISSSESQNLHKQYILNSSCQQQQQHLNSTLMQISGDLSSSNKKNAQPQQEKVQNSVHGYHQVPQLPIDMKTNRPAVQPQQQQLQLASNQYYQQQPAHSQQHPSVKQQQMNVHIGESSKLAYAKQPELTPNALNQTLQKEIVGNLTDDFRLQQQRQTQQVLIDHSQPQPYPEQSQIQRQIGNSKFESELVHQMQEDKRLKQDSHTKLSQLIANQQQLSTGQHLSAIHKTQQMEYLQAPQQLESQKKLAQSHELQSKNQQQLHNQMQLKALQQQQQQQSSGLNAKTSTSESVTANPTTQQFAQIFQQKNLLHGLSQEQVAAMLSASANASSAQTTNCGISANYPQQQFQIKLQQQQQQQQQQNNSALLKQQKLQSARPQSVMSPSVQPERQAQTLQATSQLPRPLSNLAVAAAAVNNQLVSNTNNNSELTDPSSMNAQQQLIALYNSFNLMNPIMQQNAAALYARTLTPNIPTLAKNWPSMVTASSQGGPSRPTSTFPTVPTPTSSVNQNLIGSESLELLRQKAAQQLQAMQSQTQKQQQNLANNASNAAASVTNSNLLLQQQLQQNSQNIVAFQQRNAQQHQQQQQQQQQHNSYNAQHQQLLQKPQQPSSNATYEQHPQHNLVQKNPNEKYPVVWQGQLAMKTTDTLVQLHRVCGNDRFIELTNQELVIRANGINSIRITQRMRLETSQLETLTRKMEKEENYISLVCLPCGRNREDISTQTEKMRKNFIEYFTEKMAAGIINQGPVPNPSCVAHVFPPSNFATSHLTRYAPDLLVTIEKHNACYLFVVITYTG